MNKKKIMIWALVIVGILLVLSMFGDDKIEESPIKLEDAGEKGDVNLLTTIHQEKYLNDKDLEFTSSHFDLVLMAYPFKEYVDKLREKNPDMVVLHFTNPYFAYGEKFWEEDVKIEEVEPDWMLETEDDEIIYFDASIYEGTGWGSAPIMDVRNKAWQKYYSEQTKKFIDSSGMDGLFLDTFNEDYQFWTLKDDKFAKSYTEEGWKQSAYDFLDTLKKDHRGTLIVYNGISNSPGNSLELPSIGFLKDTDGTAYEAFSVYLNMDKDDKTKKYYFDHSIMTAMKKVVDEDKIFLIQVSGKNNKESRLYALASFLLLQNDKTYFYYAPDEAQIYWYPEWELKIGKPLGKFYIEDEVYKRDFEKAQILVNPKTFNGEILIK